ncbi:MAG: heparinase II/III family protein [Caulobacteraceae bacterium]|nr:heparinase II/III family protein [Caulobacteraceae bacterium]
MAGGRARLWLPALGRTLAQQARTEWFGTPFHAMALGGPQPDGIAAAPRDPRPIDPERGAALLRGEFILAGATLVVGPRGDPWNRPSPGRLFAVRLHRFEWMGDLIAAGEIAAAQDVAAKDIGLREALRLTLDWRRVFGRWNTFSWSPDILERRVFNLACAARAMVALASDWEAANLIDSLARQARHLLSLGDEPPRAAERLIAVALAGTALGGAAGSRLLVKALPRLDAALEQAVLPDGGHATRSPEAGMELLLDLLTLDDGLSQLGRPPAERISQAIDRLAAGVRFFTLPDGRLAAFQGGEEVGKARIAAALAHDASGAKTTPLKTAPYAGYQRMAGKAITVMVDAAAPARDAWSLAACGQAGALEVVCGRDRLIANSGWSPMAAGPDILRLAAGGSTVSLGDGVLGAPLRGYMARALGPRLVGGPDKVEVHRRENEAAVWVDIVHAGWLPATGLEHERRLYLDLERDELRGEDRFMPGEKAEARPVAVAVRFHLHPEVRALISRDQRSVLLKGASNHGWWLRSDASEVAIEPSLCFREGLAVRTSQIVLRGRLRADRGGRVRWKLAAAEGQ